MMDKEVPKKNQDINSCHLQAAGLTDGFVEELWYWIYEQVPHVNNMEDLKMLLSKAQQCNFINLKKYISELIEKNENEHHGYYFNLIY